MAVELYPLSRFWAGSSESPGIAGLESGFGWRLNRMFEALPEQFRGQASILSGYRSVQHQQRLWNDAVAKYGSAEAARKWVAPPGRSNHNKGLAADLTMTSPAVTKWFHDNAARFGLAFNLNHEDWHIEPLGLRDGTYQSSGQTYGEGVDWGADWSGYGVADEEAYIDGLGLFEPDNHDPETQFLRIADLMSGVASTGADAQEIRTVDPRPAMNRNMGIEVPDEPAN